MSDWIKLEDHGPPGKWRKTFSRTYRTPNGKEKTFDISVMGPASSVLAITTDGNVVMVEQFRPGPQETLLELPGGIVDKGEHPDTAAARELLEETGYAGELIPVGSWWLSAYATGKKYGYLATNCKYVQEPRPDDDEFITVKLVPLEDFRELLKTSEMVDAIVAYRALKVYDGA